MTEQYGAGGNSALQKSDLGNHSLAELRRRFQSNESEMSSLQHEVMRKLEKEKIEELKSMKEGQRKMVLDRQKQDSDLRDKLLGTF